MGTGRCPIHRVPDTPPGPRVSRWYELYQTGEPEALEDRPSRPSRVWNRLPEDIRSRVVELALNQPELSPRELAVRFDL